MTSCRFCDENANIYATYCPRCCARFCLTLPTEEQARHTVEQWCMDNHLSPDDVYRADAELRAERLNRLFA